MVMGTRPKATCLSVVSEAGLGGLAIDHAIFEHWAAETQERYKETPSLASRRGVRLLTQCERAKKVLSSVPETEVVCENLVEVRQSAVLRDSFRSSGRHASRSLESIFPCASGH